ncbi:hypothetical protein I0P70_11625 [Pontibacter sp. FD36]|uniref:hypothetical protein n=1 Tax=Pontibacter sp. FD36 TaxID=2789860 RepID=UPI0018A9AA7A|nr:hypothetical protein [Pontibacter sp. FD36]MBF8963899.1 hypothetical protein [Pontibacter sp. FD36]
MNNTDFINRIAEVYVDARALAYGDFQSQIKRGKSHSISGKAEDLFALFLAKNLNDQSLKYFVDKPISFRVNEQSRKKAIQPDLFIMNKSGVVTHYFDLKMDLGWQRELQPYLKDKNELIQQIRGKKASYKSGGEKHQVTFSDNLVYQIIILSGKNINGDALESHKVFCTPFDTLKLYVLTSGVHLNMYGNDKREHLKIHDEEFEKLMQDTRSLLQ